MRLPGRRAEAAPEPVEPAVEWDWSNDPAPMVDAELTLPQQDGRRHVITGILASYKKRGEGLLTVLDNRGIRLKQWVVGERDLLDFELRGEPGQPLRVYLHIERDGSSADRSAYLTVFGRTEPV